MPRAGVLFTGGTISMVVDPEAGGNVPSLDGAGILARVPGLDAIASVEAVDLGRTPASHFSLARLLEIGRRIDEVAASAGIDGVVVVQGTDTIEETAFCWDLTLRTGRPVVVTGAMRSASEAGYDGPANLRDAVRCAVEPGLAGEGVVVVLGGSIEPADDVAKTHATSLTTFASPNGGSLGRIEQGKVVLLRRRAGRRRLDASGPPARVEVILATVGAEGHLLDAAVEGGAEGLVVAATGAGNTSPELLAAAERAIARGLPVVLVSRAAAGAVGTGYAFPGGGATWARAGAILAGHLSAVKARVALSLAIGAGLGRDEIARLVADPRP